MERKLLNFDFFLSKQKFILKYIKISKGQNYMIYFPQREYFYCGYKQFLLQVSIMTQITL